MVLGILRGGQPNCLSFNEFSAMSFGFELFPCSPGVFFFNFFFHFCLFDGVCFQYFRVFGSFLFSKRSVFFSFSSSIPSVICCFPPFIISMAHFSMPDSISSVPVLGFSILFRFCQKVWCRLWTLPGCFLFFFLVIFKFEVALAFSM